MKGGREKDRKEKETRYKIRKPMEKKRKNKENRKKIIMVKVK